MISTRLDRCLAEARARFAADNPRSRAAHEHACRHLPGGSTRSAIVNWPFALRIERGEGARLVDIDGHEYVDVLGDFSAGLFGHSDPVVAAAVAEALTRGMNLGAHSVKEAELASLICERFTSIEAVRFTSSGTEANLLALMAARLHTGRERIVVFEGAYHGSVLSFGQADSPLNVPMQFIRLPYNDGAAVRDTFAQCGDTIAAVLFEPMLGSGGCLLAQGAFVSTLVESARNNGALLLCDEIMTSRLDWGGLQARLGLRPDVTTLGKYLGGGLNFGAFGGSNDIMSRFDYRMPNSVSHSGTFNNNGISVAAGIAGMARYSREVVARLHERGEQLRARLNDVCRRANAPIAFTGMGSMLHLHVGRSEIRSARDVWAGDERLRALLVLNLIDRGYWIGPRGFMALSLAISEDDCRNLVDTLAAMLCDLGRALGGWEE